jgi:hypothetical protein
MSNLFTQTTNNLIDLIRNKDATTYNGAITNWTSLNSCLDLFFIAGASRKMTVDDINSMFQTSYLYDKITTIKIIFWAGDIRAGAGERRFFKLGLDFLASRDPDFLCKTILSSNIEFFNRYDTLFELVKYTTLKPTILAHINKKINKKDQLLAKWLPRKDQYNKFKKTLCTYLEINDVTYRKNILSISNTVEQKLSAKKYDEIVYSNVPSVAFNKYRDAFKRNDETRFDLFLDKVEKGEEKINASVIFPHTLYQAYNQGKDEKSIIAQWNSLPNFMQDTQERILPVCDVSGSMTGLPMEVSISLGIYISERNEGVFKDAFLTFSSTPKLQFLTGNLIDRIAQLQTADWGQSTNLLANFELILKKAVSVKLPQSQMPTVMMIISDMEFNHALYDNSTNFESIKLLYEKAGYQIPKLVFWNVNGRVGNSPTTKNDHNTVLVSGFSPTILTSILSGKVDQFTPLGIMNATLDNPLYERIFF